MPVEDQIAPLLLAHYDAHARALPWRSPPGAPPPDPYPVWLSEIMLQQTTVAAAAPYFARFTQRWPDVQALAVADDADVMAAWAGLGYYARARNLLACARAVASAHGGTFPDTEAGLRALPGLGAYTAAAVAAIAFGQRAVVVDANVERVVARLFAIAVPLPKGRTAIRAAADSITPAARAGDFAQAMMDLGATICTARSPRCLACPLAGVCAGRATGDPAAFPVKPPKAARPVRHGTIFWLERDGAVLLVRRPARGLLGGMRALPTGPWQDEPPGIADAPVTADWQTVSGEVRHVFTHFELRLRVVRAASENHCNLQPGWEWWPVKDIAAAGLPTVFAKAAAIGRETCAA